MKRCPHCDSDLTSGMATRTAGSDGHHTATATVLVTCPDCDRAIDGLPAQRV